MIDPMTELRIQVITGRRILGVLSERGHLRNYVFGETDHLERCGRQE
jgi:hypothetical protein